MAQAIKADGMLANATAHGAQLMEGALWLSERFPITDIRGRCDDVTALRPPPLRGAGHARAAGAAGAAVR